MMKEADNSPKYKLFIRLLTANQKRIYGFIYALMPNQAASEDIMQQTSLFMWEHFDDFREGTNFSAWGITIARNLVRQYCRKQKRSLITFDSQTIENLIDQSDVFETQDDQITALRHCFKKLQNYEQEMLRMRYIQRIRVPEIAESLNRTTGHIYRVMARIHNSLLKCIKRQLSS